MAQYFSYLKVLCKKLALAFFVFSLCRIIFFLFYTQHFNDVSFSIFIYGIRFDLVAISFLFAPVVLLDLLPFKFRNFKWYKKLSNTIYFIAIFVGIALNMLDVGYFEYTLKRTTADLFDLVSEGDDFWTLLPHYIIDFWYAYLALAILFYITVKIYKFWIKTDSFSSNLYTKKEYVIHSSIFVGFIGLLIIGMRGGVQYKPINIVNAAQYTESQNIPIVLNTPFTLMKTISKESIEIPAYFEEDKLTNIYNPEHFIIGDGKYSGKNIVFVILESFSKEYIGYLNNKGYTPFLDSLMSYSYVYTNAYANGQRSMESLPSILAGLPQLMNTPYISSVYSSNKLDGLPMLLKKQGYNTSFYHGGANGTMGFNGFTKIVGIDNYYGMNQYPKDLLEKDYDGLWGIFDEPYLRYYADELNKKKQPFFSAIFTLSSHHPYTIPKKHANQFPKGNLAIHESIGYTDYSLKQFFAKATKMNWFKNSVFVFTADHSSLSESKFYKTKLNRLAIPMFIYEPALSKNTNDSSLFQHTDLLPEILKHTNLNDSIITFGNIIQNSDNKYIINYISNNYQVTYKDYFLIFNGEKTTSFFNYKTDTLLVNNLIKNATKTEVNLKNKMEQRLKAFIQQYNKRIVNNQLSKH